MKKLILSLSLVAFILSSLFTYSQFFTYSPTSTSYILPVESLQGGYNVKYINGNTVNFHETEETKGVLFLYDLENIAAFQITEYTNKNGNIKYYLTDTYKASGWTAEDHKLYSLGKQLQKVNNEFEQWAKENNYPSLN